MALYEEIREAFRSNLPALFYIKEEIRFSLNFFVVVLNVSLVGVQIEKG